MECLESSQNQEAKNAASQQDESEDDIEFVGEAILRPILDCIDLVSSGDEESSSSSNKKVKSIDYNDNQKEGMVASTLDRLARHVELQKKLKEEKNKAFKEKVDSQHAHGLQQLEFIHKHSDTEAARLCVNQWLKMPGLKPGTVNSGRKIPPRSVHIPSGSKSILCPIMHCNKKFDNGALLLGHLKRFDHCPCDPAVTIHGRPSSSFACIVCKKRFPTSQQYSDHCLSKASENDGHERNYPPQHIQFFACPCCFLLFSLRDECLQHMSEEKHFSQTFKLSDVMETPLPLPFPAYAKNLLVSLCKEVPFQVKCTSCHQELRSHVELTAHFRTRCRNAGPVVLSEKTISQVAEIFKAKGFCQRCNELLVDDNHISQHNCKTLHDIKILTTMEQSILIFCHTNMGNKNYLKDRRLFKSSPLKRSLTIDTSLNDQIEAISKRKKDLEDKSQEFCNTHVVKTWTCECSLSFPSEELVEKHIFSANRICHKCAVCGKLSEDASIIRLHMSRFHGGAHLTNFLFWCQACSVGLQKGSDVMAHMTECHIGHSYFCEKYCTEDELALSSNRLTDTFCNNSLETENQSFVPMELSPPSSPMDLAEKTSHQGKWQCCLCEEIFDSEDTVKQHCMSLDSHHFHRYSCDLCKVTFRKTETLYRHCQDRHSEIVQIKYFCGFCGDLFFDTEEEFLIHFRSFHSTDYVCLSETAETSIKNFEMVEESNLLSCGCREKYASKENRKADYKKCQEAMLAKGNLWFRCTLCSSTAQSHSDMVIHLACHTSDKSKEELYVVRCGACNKNFSGLTLAHQHFHSKHCFSQKPKLVSPAESKVFQFSASGSCVDKKPDKLKLSAALTTRSSKSLSPKKSGYKKEEVPGQDDDLPDLDYLRTMTHIIMMDLDNWGNLFHQLPATLNQGTFIWGFQGGHNNWKQPVNCKMFNYLNRIGCFFLHPRCGTRREAADFAICVHVGRLDEHLPKHIPFTILSGDKSFLELESQLKMTQRTTRILDPHKIDADIMCALLNSISDTAKENEEDSPMTTEQYSQGAEIQESEDVQLQEAIRRSLQEI
ncbi:E3 SUMO-protein ligase ZNF451 [Eublepharis macularius]|uniref:E3 SUMO-protein ligase ZNF451 n=1 Tax=Eublepharis macularius TaxID=481883 RepID=A0AA97JFI3_EUBMA|nr:E3 SUMO-protein ligase ZNF451 [Eublepharis macularius]